jgi:predicted anti-sigma-YlaC factor YlaD
MKLQLDCKEVSRLISEGLDETLPAPERARMRLHFVMCSTCRNVDEQMGFLRRAMRQLGREDELPPK